MANSKKKGGSRPKGRPQHGKSKAKKAGPAQRQPKRLDADDAAEGSEAPARSKPAATKARPAPAAGKTAAKAKAAQRSDRGPTRQERIEARRRSKRRKDQIWRFSPIAVIVGIVAIALLLRGDGPTTTQPSEIGSIKIQGASRDGRIPDGEKVPQFTAPSLGGGSDFNLADYSGAPYVLAVWTPDCKPCQKEMPILSTVALQFPRIPLVTVVTGVNTGPTTPETFISQQGVNFGGVAVDDEPRVLAKALGAVGPDAFPTIYYVGKDDTVAASISGEPSQADVTTRFQALDDLLPKIEPSPSITPTPVPDGGSGQGQGQGPKATQPTPVLVPSP